jgi:hypothetical protein
LLCRSQYLLVYRSPMAEKLFWGLDDADNTMLKLATVKANLTEFPAGCAFEVGCACFCAVVLLTLLCRHVQVAAMLDQDAW